MSTQMLHFRIGADAGALLMQISQEHLIYNYNPDKALKTIEESLHGCPKDLALKLIKGDMVLLVDEEEQVFIVSERIEKLHDVFPKIDIKDWFERQQKEIRQNSMELNKVLKEMRLTMKYGHIYKTFTYDQVLKFIVGNDDAILDDVIEDEKVIELSELIRITKMFIEKTMKVQAIMSLFQKWYPEEFIDNKIYIDNKNYLKDVINELNNVLKCDFSDIEEEIKEIENFIDSANEIDNVLSKGIEPVNIMDNYSAGWLSPEGIYYGLNGEIANMLHIQISDTLLEAGIISTNDDVLNSSVIIERLGWVKIHGCNIQFAGCLNKKTYNNISNVNITKIQAEIIFKYLHELHNDFCKLGWRMTPITAHMFLRLTDNPELMNEKYFNF